MLATFVSLWLINCKACVFVLFLQMNMFQPGPVATTVVCLTQVVTEDELKDDEEFEDIMEDMRQEGGKFGKRFLLFCILLYPFWRYI